MTDPLSPSAPWPGAAERLTVARLDHRPFVRAVEAVVSPFSGLNAFSLTRDSLMRAAERSSGASDWGDTQDLEGLQLMCKDLAEQPPSPLGQLGVRGVLVGAMANRLGLQRLLNQGAALGAPRPPVLIAGLHRSGTTLLHRLLGALPDFNALPFHRQFNPLPTPLSALKGAGALALSRWIGPEMWQLHPVSSRRGDECWMLVAPSLRSFDLALHWKLPRYTEWLDQADMGSAYRIYADMLALVQRDFPGRFALKSCSHLSSLPELLRALPEARVIWLHRDPVYTIASFCSLSALQHRAMYGRVDPGWVGPQMLDRSVRAIERGVQACAQLPADRVHHMHFKQLVSDPVQALSEAFERFGEPLDEGARAAVKRTHEGRQRLPPHRFRAALWGLNVPEARERLRGYSEAFGVEREEVP